MILYASHTTTKRNLAALRANGWRLLVTPFSYGGPMDFAYCLDNGAWRAHQQGTPFDEDAFRGLLSKYGAGADFILLPDHVGGGWWSFRFSMQWLEECREFGAPLLVPVQDGMTPELVDETCAAEGIGFAIGGTTAWKESVLCSPDWADLATRHYCHVLRVNTRPRYRQSVLFGARSIDGSSPSRWSVNAGILPAESRRTLLPFQ